ncbi:hypothetical protein [Streptomyces sp. NPDC001070]
MISRRGHEAGTLRVDPEPVTSRLVQTAWRAVRAGAELTGLTTSADPTGPRRSALLRLAPPLDPRAGITGEWHILLTPVWRTAGGTTMAVAQLPVPCPQCIEPHGGGICALLPLSGG